LIFLKFIVLPIYQIAWPQTDFKSPFAKLISGLLLLNGTASIKPTRKESWAAPKSLTLRDIHLFQAFNKSDGWIIRIPCRIKRNRPGQFNPGDRIRRLHDLPRFCGQGVSDTSAGADPANVNQRRVYGGYISRGLSTVGACHGWGSAGRRNAADLRYPR